jgi:hypothetical protein
MEVRFLNLKANNVIFHKEGNVYTEYKVESIHFKSGKYFYNGVRMFLEDMFVRKEDGTFGKVELEVGYLQDELRDCYIYHDGGARRGWARVSYIDLTRGFKDWEKTAKFWFTSQDNELEIEVPMSRIFFSKANALESVDTIINNLDGTTEVQKGIVNLIQLDEDQKRLVGALKSVLDQMKEADIHFVGYDVTFGMQLYNGRHCHIDSDDYNEDDVFVNIDTPLTEEIIKLPNTHFANDDCCAAIFTRK